MKPQLPGDPGSPAQIAEIAKAMTEIGYDAAVQTEGGESFIAAHNCVFHRLASDHPEVCGFDVAMLSASSGCEVEHRSCMIRGGSACRFHFQAGKKI
jgi:predicted ArsR family transcriptional regulator